MTWGQLRFQLQTAAPGVSTDLLDEFLNSRYGQVLQATDWKGLKYHSTIQTTSAYRSATDSVNLAVGSVNVAGVGTAWTPAITGRQFYRPGDTVVYTATYVSATGLTLDRPYEGNGTDTVGEPYNAAPYVLMQDIYPLPPDTRAVVECLDPSTGFPLSSLSSQEMDASCGPRTLAQNPTTWAAYADSPESALPVFKQIRFYPPPLYARGIPVEYIHAAVGFNGSNTGAAPLPFVTASVLLAGCRASIETHLATQSEGAGASAHLAAASTYTKEFLAELDRLLLVEHAQRRQIVAIKMAPRFVRHRLQRAGRGVMNDWRGGTPGGPD